jgi:3-oxoacyl-[acyl-carrier-protein] synthase II
LQGIDMNAFIKSAAVISPQNTFGVTHLPGDIISYAGVYFLKCIEPVYKDYIDPMIARRMSRIVKMSLCSALKCMQDAKVEIPDAIITGTGLGCLEDTDKFLSSIFINEEKLLNPTPFIQSTHNTVASSIALAIKCHNYNSTYTHRGFSFESAIQDAMLQLEENPQAFILAGGFDELTVNSYNIAQRLALWKNHPVSNLNLKEYNSRGNLPGEGTAFFMLSGISETNDLAWLKAVDTFFKPVNHMDILDHFDQILLKNGLKSDDVDLIILGVNGNLKEDNIYYQLIKQRLKNHSVGYFKHLCGEYGTSASFALWLAAMILKNQMVPDYIMLNNKKPEKLNNIIIYNHMHGINHVLYLITQC